MIKNDFQKVYRKIISQEPIFSDQDFKPIELVKHKDDYYSKIYSVIRYIPLDGVVEQFYKEGSNLLYYTVIPFQIYVPWHSNNICLHDNGYTIREYDTIKGYKDKISNSLIALEFSIAHYYDIKGIDKNTIAYGTTNDAEYLIQYDPEQAAKMCNSYIYDVYDGDLFEKYEKEFGKEYTYDIDKGGIVFEYNIVDLGSKTNLYHDIDIIENKKILSEKMPHTLANLKYKLKEFIISHHILDKIAHTLYNKIIEIKNNY